MVLDNGVWAQTLKRDNVHLITDPIEEITPRGVVTADGDEHAADVIIYGTGFQASRFLTPMKVVGRGGIDLNEQWDGDARAYMGITVPNFPNFFMLYGPNTNIVVNGSIIYFSECEVQYVMGCLRLLLEDGHRAMDCKPRRPRRLQRAHRRGEPPAHVGRVEGEQLVQERQGPRRAELAVQPDRVLAADARAGPGRLRVPVAPECQSGRHHVRRFAISTFPSAPVSRRNSRSVSVRTSSNPARRYARRAGFVVST